jgi:hypothetical protein
LLDKTAVETHKYYKPVYLLEFRNAKLEQTLYKILDSLTGDLDGIWVQDAEQEVISQQKTETEALL